MASLFFKKPPWKSLSFLLWLSFFNLSALEARDLPPVTVNLLSASTHAGHNTSLLLGIEITLEKGWHIYAPQKDASLLPPSLENKNSFNIHKLKIFWPPPQKILENHTPIFLYKNHIVLPFVISLIDPLKQTVLKTHLKLVACNKTSCVPYEKDLDLVLPPGPLKLTPDAPLLENVFKDAQRQKSSFSFFQNSSFSSFLALLGTAFIGGIILNFMPCVLPILSLKLFSLLRKTSSQNSSKKVLKTRFFISFLGILSFFFAFGLFASIAQFFGKTIGWGTHFQNPFFLSIMIFILAIFSLNLWGIFEFNLPSSFLNWISSRKIFTPSSSPPLHSFSDLLKDYTTGLFSAILSTPCTAPFLSVALGASLTQSPFLSLSIFLCIGVGFGLPYLLMMLSPNFLFLLPSPGPWMQTFKRILSMMLMATALWMSFILIFPSQEFSFLGPSQSPWVSFSPSALKTHVQGGRSVLVNVTADWCLTCKVNTFRVYEAPSIQALLKKHKVILMRADWTRPNETIEYYLKSFGRAGIPFAVYYSPLHPEGIPLPELLSPSFLAKLIEDS